MGPMAQDFRAAFGLGVNEKTIVTVDADGVALAAIQGLNEKTTGLEKRNAALEERVAKLTLENSEMRSRLDRLESGKPSAQASIFTGAPSGLLLIGLGLAWTFVARRRGEGVAS